MAARSGIRDGRRWRLAGSLAALIDQVDQVAPGRSQASDGSIGDAAHASRASAHNPDAGGVVRAVDITHDPAGGLDAHTLAEELLAAQDPRLQYVISRSRIGAGPAGPAPGRWRRYTGTNPHDKHVHVEVVTSSRADSLAAWQTTTTQEDTMNPAQERKLDYLSAQLRSIGGLLGYVSKQVKVTAQLVVTTGTDNRQAVLAELDQLDTQIDAIAAQLDELDDTATRQP